MLLFWEDIDMRLTITLLACILTSTLVPAAEPAAGAGAGSAAAASDADHAAKHAKLTGCRDQARAKKLTGSDKKAFIRQCVAAP